MTPSTLTPPEARPATPRRPRVRQTIDVLSLDDGTVYLVLPTGDADLVIRDAPPEVPALLVALDGRCGVDEVERELAERFPELDPRFVVASVAQLWELGVVEDAASDAEAGLGASALERLDRQLAYFGELAPAGHARAAYQRRLADARVVLLGLGGLGSWIAYALAGTGVGRIDGVDHDRVEASNLNRQILYGPGDVGAAKAEAAARRLREFAPALDFRPSVERIDSQADVARIVEGADFVVSTVDWPRHDIEHWVSGACFAHGVPFISSSHFPPFARIGPTYVPGRTACFACDEARHRAQTPDYDRIVSARRETAPIAPTFAPGCALIGGTVASDVVHFLTGLAEPATLASAIVFDTRTMEMRREAVVGAPGCEICGGVAGAAGGTAERAAA